MQSTTLPQEAIHFILIVLCCTVFVLHSVVVNKTLHNRHCVQMNLLKFYSSWINLFIHTQCLLLFYCWEVWQCHGMVRMYLQPNQCWFITTCLEKHHLDFMGSWEIKYCAQDHGSQTWDRYSEVNLSQKSYSSLSHNFGKYEHTDLTHT